MKRANHDAAYYAIRVEGSQVQRERLYPEGSPVTIGEGNTVAVGLGSPGPKSATCEGHK